MDGVFDFTSTTGYTSDFFGCFSDPMTCLSIYCCPCLVIGVNSGKLHKNGEFDIPACLCSTISGYRIRRKVQQMKGIQEPEDASVCAITICSLCTLTQDAIEINAMEQAGMLGQPQMQK